MFKRFRRLVVTPAALWRLKIVALEFFLLFLLLLLKSDTNSGQLFLVHQTKKLTSKKPFETVKISKTKWNQARKPSLDVLTDAGGNGWLPSAKVVTDRQNDDVRSLVAPCFFVSASGCYYCSNVSRCGVHHMRQQRKTPNRCKRNHAFPFNQWRSEGCGGA